MKAASSALIALLNGPADTFFLANCFTITLLNGAVYRCCDVDVAVTIGSNTFPGSGNSAQISGLKYSIKRGLEVDEQTAHVAATPADLIDGTPFLVAMATGLLDDAHFQWERAFLPTWFAPATGSIILFSGRVSTIDKLGRIEGDMKIKSELVLLDRPYPSHSYAASCQWTLYGYGCGLNKASFSGTATVASGTTQSKVYLAGASFSDASSYDQGTISFTSGVLSGQSFTVKGWNDGPLWLGLARPLPALPAVGDHMTMYWGCDHTLGASGCARFNNVPQYRGAPFVPPQSTGL